MSYKNEAIKYLENYADILEFAGANKFKINAFRGAANVIRRLDVDLEEMLHDGSITNIKGIGKGIQKFLYELLDGGKVKEYEDHLGSIPEGILEILQIRGLGVKKVKLLYEQLNIKSIDELDEACKNNLLISVKGFTNKSQGKIREEITNIRKHSKFVLISKGEHIGASIVDKLKSLKSIDRIEISGEIRRKSEIISKIDIIIGVNSILNIRDQIITYYKYSILSNNSSEVKLLLDSDFPIPVILHICTTEKFVELLFNTTGSAKFVAHLDANKLLGAYKDEIEIFDNIGLKYVIPEMREENYFSAPINLRTNSNIEVAKMNGLLHFHTNFSDGTNTLHEMAEEAKNIGFEYLAVCDHSKSAFYANGLSEDRVLNQKDEIQYVRDQIDIEIFHGIESDILRDGSLDYSNDFMSNFDFVVASVHSQFNLNEEEMTNRIINAIENPHTDVLGHPTGRLLLSRSPYQININKVIEACAKNDVAIEINASPYRLDLDWRNFYFAREVGCKFAINPDAHSTTGIHDVEYGVKIARKGGIQMSEVINYLSLDDFKKYLSRKVSRNL